MPPFQMNGDCTIGDVQDKKGARVTETHVTEIATVERRVMIVLKTGRVGYLPLGESGVTGLNRPCVMRELQMIGFDVSFMNPDETETTLPRSTPRMANGTLGYGPAAGSPGRRGCPRLKSRRRASPFK